MFRLDPQGPAEAYKTYHLAAPIQTHYRPATCGEVDCQQQANGWRTPVDESTDLGQRQAHYIRAEAGRRFTEERNEAGLTVFTFAAGQACFAQHQTSLDREPVFFVADGDWRGNPYGTRPYRHANAADWIEDFGGHQQDLADRIERG